MNPSAENACAPYPTVRKLEAQVRELRCLYRLTSLINDRELPLETLFRRVIEQVPRAYQYPEIACARLECSNVVVQTPNFRDTEWMQSATLGTLRSRIGSLTIGYLKPRPEEAEGPFLEEERELIRTVGELLGERIERSRIEDALRLHKERMGLVIGAAPLILWATDRHGVVTLVQGNNLARFGLIPEEAMGEPVEFLDGRAPEFSSCMRKAIGGGEITADIRMGDSVLQSRFAPLRDLEGGIYGAIGAQMDITARVHTEQELKRTNGLLREVFAGTHFLMAYLDRDLRYQRVNRAFARANGMDQERFIGRKHFDMFPDGRIETIFKGVLSSREPYVAEDITLRSFGGMEAGSWDMDLLPLKGERAEVEGLVLSLIDRTKRRQAIDELEKSRAEFERLASYLQDLREEERRSIAREIHDELGGLLTSIKMDLALIRKSVSAPGAGFEPAINRAEDLANRSIEIMRRIVYDLRPQILDDLGLIPALEWLVSEMKKRSVVRFFLNIPPTEVQLPKEIATALFRIVQEALTNVVRHANATRVEIALKAGEDAVEVRVSDNGSGITEEQMRRPNAFGLIGIHERVSHFGGNVTIRGLPEKGTTLIVTMPAKRGIT